jgi:hypothetical protein
MTTFMRAAILSNGFANVFAALALLLAPEWFYHSIGEFPPFNQHYMGDAGAFLLALGIGLLIAARDPIRHRSLIGIAIVGNAVHLANHVYDDIVLGHLSMAHLLLDTLPVLVFGAWLVWAYWSIGVQHQRHETPVPVGD